MGATVETETVTTWADGSGRWYARVDFPAPGYPWQRLEERASRIRAKAQRAIRREIDARGAGLGSGWRCRVVQTDSVWTDGIAQSVTYSEL